MERETSLTAIEQNLLPLNTWDAIIGKISLLRTLNNDESKISAIVELLVNIRLLDREERIYDARDAKSSMETIHARLYEQTRLTLEAETAPAPEYLYYFRELLKKLPLRGRGDIIGDIRSAAEYFEEGRCDDDPMRSFAGDLRKEVHRKLSPRILTRYIKPYLELVRDGSSAGMARSGYFSFAAGFDPASEPPKFVALAEEMDEKLSYLWDYENGDIVSVKKSLESHLDLFEKCFLRKEMETFLSICTAAHIRDTHNLADCFKRLVSFKKLLRQSYHEKRIGLFDYLNLDLDIGRLIFIFTNDLTNNHYETVTIANVRECAALVKEFILLLMQKGILPENSGPLLRALAEIEQSETVDMLKTKRAIQGIATELQRFMKQNIFFRLSQMLNHVLEAYKIPTASLSPIKDRFFNNFIRTTEFHAVSEFIEKIVLFLNRELASKSLENSLYGKYKLGSLPEFDGNYEASIAVTWAPTPESIRPFLGGKGNGIIDMKNLGINVPHAFILGLPVCIDMFADNGSTRAFRPVLKKYLGMLEKVTGKMLGLEDNPLLVSVRSGTTISLPGSMCNILNVGITPRILGALSARHGQAFADGIYVRFLKNVLTALNAAPAEAGFSVPRAEEVLRGRLGAQFLEDPFEQLLKCIELVFASSKSESVSEYLRELSVDFIHGTAVTVQEMVFGNKNHSCMSGVLFTRNPINGADELFGEYKEMAQGEDVVMSNIITRHIAGIAAPLRTQLDHYKGMLEKELKHELDIEFTVEDNRLYLLQTRRATVSAYAKLVIDTDMLRKGIITVAEYLRRIERLCAGNAFVSVPLADEGLREWRPPVGTGMPINHGTAKGVLVLTREKLDEQKARNESVIYFAQNTKPSDFYVINNSSGIISVFPGRTSHAAITSITLNKPCIVGCSNAVIDLHRRTVTFRGETDTVIHEGEVITLDANGGAIYRGAVPLTNSFVKTHDILDAVSADMSAAQAAGRVETLLNEKLAALDRDMTQRRKGLSGTDRALLRGKNVLVRLDLNVPCHNGVITNAARIEAALPTVKYLLESGATPILCSHFGEPDAQEKKGKSREDVYREFSLGPVAQYLRTALGDVVFHENSVASSGVLVKKQNMVQGRTNVIENLRFAVGEKENDTVFARGLAGLSDGVFVNDAFGTCHRNHASIVGVPRYVSHKLAGFLIEKELRYLGSAVTSPSRPFVGITGGSKISSKLGVIESLLRKLDLLIVGGGIGYTLLKAGGANVEKSLVEDSMLDAAKKLLAKYGDKIVLPRDFVVTDRFDFKNQCVGAVRRNVTVIPPGWESFDIGQASIDHAMSILATAQTILWNGPIGAFELKEGSAGTLSLAQGLARLAGEGKTVIIGGGDSAAAVTLAGVADKMTHVSTGGGASLEFLERLTLPGIAVLDPE